MRNTASFLTFYNPGFYDKKIFFLNDVYFQICLENMRKTLIKLLGNPISENNIFFISGLVTRQDIL